MLIPSPGFEGQVTAGHWGLGCIPTLKDQWLIDEPVQACCAGVEGVQGDQPRALGSHEKDHSGPD